MCSTQACIHGKCLIPKWSESLGAAASDKAAAVSSEERNVSERIQQAALAYLKSLS
jgi:hypothetical protein